MQGEQQEKETLNGSLGSVLQNAHTLLVRQLPLNLWTDFFAYLGAVVSCAVPPLPIAPARTAVLFTTLADGMLAMIAFSGRLDSVYANVRRPFAMRREALAEARYPRILRAAILLR